MGILVATDGGGSAPNIVKGVSEALIGHIRGINGYISGNCRSRRLFHTQTQTQTQTHTHTHTHTRSSAAVTHLCGVWSEPLQAQERAADVLGEHHGVRTGDLLSELARDHCKIAADLWAPERVR